VRISASTGLWLDAAGVDTSLIAQVPGKFCASFFCSTDANNNQIASFYTGAMADAGQLSFRTVPDCTLAIIAPNDPEAMLAVRGRVPDAPYPLNFRPWAAVRAMSGEQLRDGAVGATYVIVNDYELELLRQKTGLSDDEILSSSAALIVTRGEHGSSVLTRSGRVDVPRWCRVGSSIPPASATRFAAA
jgi:adenosine kinase